MTAHELLRCFVGERLLACASAWHEFDGERADTPSDTWLRFESGVVNLRGGPGGQGVRALFEEIGPPYEMQDFGRVVIAASTPGVLASRIGERLDAITDVGYRPWGDDLVIGCILHLSGGEVAVVNIADETEIFEWTTSAARRRLLQTLPDQPHS